MKKRLSWVLDLAKVYAYETEGNKFEFNFRTLGQQLVKLAGDLNYAAQESRKMFTLSQIYS